MMKYLIVSLLICFAIAGCHAQQEHSFIKNKNDNTLLWQISGKGLKHPSFLFGTFHLMCADDIHFSDQLKEAIKQCDTMYMELDMDDPSTLLGGMLYMNMKDGCFRREIVSPLSEFIFEI